VTSDSLASRLVTANRILTDQGILDGFGHVTAREPGADELLVSRYQSSALVTEADIIRMDLDGNVLDTEAETYSETAIHRAIYRHRDDVNAVVHHHAPAVMPFTVTDTEIRPVFHLGAVFHEGVPTFDDYDHAARGRLVVGEAESDRMAEVLGDRRAQLLEGHGANVVGETLEEAVVSTVLLAMNAAYQREAMDIGEPRFYDGPPESLETMVDDVVLRPRTVRRFWDHLVAMLPASSG
jgi:ribulose-5-phosphate 4-epimerase/fuculose-1-phosphate aldolase